MTTITITIQETDTNLKEVLDRVENGDTVEITRDGKSVATILGSADVRPARNPEKIGKAIENWERYRDEHDITLGGISIRELIDDGRKY